MECSFCIAVIPDKTSAAEGEVCVGQAGQQGLHDKPG